MKKEQEGVESMVRLSYVDRLSQNTKYDSFHVSMSKRVKY